VTVRKVGAHIVVAAPVSVLDGDDSTTVVGIALEPDRPVSVTPVVPEPGVERAVGSGLSRLDSAVAPLGAAAGPSPAG